MIIAKHSYQKKGAKKQKQSSLNKPITIDEAEHFIDFNVFKGRDIW